MPKQISREQHDRMANAVRFLSVDAVEKAKSGHPGLPMGAADIATVLFSRYLKFDPKDPHWPDRDRFVLSAGHGSMLIYSLLHLTGYESVSIEDIKLFRQLDSKTPGHPENFMTLGVETTTGPLGAGLSTAVGMALAERILAAEFGAEAVDHFTYVLCSDGDLMEGISQEAIAIAGHLKLSKMIVFYDDNGISIDGATSLSDSVDQVARFKSANWNAVRIDGHDPEAIAAAIETAQKSDKPTLIACKTTIGFGAPKKAGTAGAHGSPLGDEEIAATRKALGWEYPAFDVPDDVASAWRDAGTRSKEAKAAWKERVGKLEGTKRDEFERRIIKGELPASFEAAIKNLKERLVSAPQEVATRKSSEIVLEAIADALPELLSGSADLTPSNNTKVKAFNEISPGNYAGRYVHWGIREHAMASAVNGIALHGGLIPLGATFLVFSDYCRPALRLAALMKLRSIFVFTHDSIGVGEDGPTHQPVEHLAALRAIPNLYVYRPADTVETAEAWELAVTNTHPSILALTRQNLPQVRLSNSTANLTAKGAYELAPASGKAEVSIFASGSEVSLALDAKKVLDEAGIATRVVSVPCMDLFNEQPEAYQLDIIGTAPVKIGVEAAIRMGWDHIIGADGAFVGMTGFGASGPAKDVYKHFGITSEAVIAAAKKKLGR